MANICIMKDNSLGGVKREFKEVARKGTVGELIVVKFAPGSEFITEGNPYKVVETVLDEDVIVLDDVGDRHLITSLFYEVLEPTDIVIIGGKRYRFEERLAEPGELILRKKNGLTYEVKDVAGDFIIVGDSQLMLEEDYVVLKRIDAPQSQDDIIANLIRRVSELERKLDESNARIDGTKNDIETWAQEVESLKHVKESKQITLDVDTFTKLIGGVRG